MEVCPVKSTEGEISRDKPLELTYVNIASGDVPPALLELLMDHWSGYPEIVHPVGGICPASNPSQMKAWPNSVVQLAKIAAKSNSFRFMVVLFKIRCDKYTIFCL